MSQTKGHKLERGQPIGGNWNMICTNPGCDLLWLPHMRLAEIGACPVTGNDRKNTGSSTNRRSTRT